MASKSSAKNSKPLTDPEDIDLLSLLINITEASKILFGSHELYELVDELTECIDIYNWPAKDWYQLLENPHQVKKSYYTVNQIIKFLVRFEPLHQELMGVAQAMAMAKKAKEEGGDVNLKVAS